MSIDKSREQIAEEFILNPEKVLFEMLTDFNDGIKVLQDTFEGVDISALEVLKGKDGENATTPERGTDYMTAEDIEAIQSYVLSLQPVPGKDFATREETLSFVKKMVGNIPTPKGKQGNPGVPGKDGSPDTGKQILNKIRKEKGFKISDVQGLLNKLNSLTKATDQIDELRKFVKKSQNVTMSVPAQEGGSGGASALDDLTDVNAPAPADGDILVFRTAGGEWVLETKPAGGASPVWADITGPINGNAVLQAELDAKSNTGHVHIIANITGLQAALDGKVSLTGDESIAGLKTFTDAQTKLDGRVGVGGVEVFGGSRLGDSDLQSDSIDTKSVNIKNTTQETLAAMFAIEDVPNDASTTRFKNYTRSDHVFDVSPKNITDLSTDDSGAAIAVVRDDSAGNREGLDMFSQNYPGSGTDVAQAAGFVSLAEGTGVSHRDVGLWFKASGVATYTLGWIVDATTRMMKLGAGLTLPEIAAPATPSAGEVALYAKTGGKVYIKDDAGLETDLTAVGGAGSAEVIKPTTDHAVSGPFTSAILAGEAIPTVIQSVQMNTAGKWELTNATTEAGADGELGIAFTSAVLDAPISVGLRGCIIRDDSFSFTKGQYVYLNTADGSWTATAPATTGNIVRKIGICIDVGYVLFMPEETYLEVA